MSTPSISSVRVFKRLVPLDILKFTRECGTSYKERMPMKDYEVSIAVCSQRWQRSCLLSRYPTSCMSIRNDSMLVSSIFSAIYTDFSLLVLELATREHNSLDGSHHSLAFCFISPLYSLSNICIYQQIQNRAKYDRFQDNPQK